MTWFRFSRDYAYRDTRVTIKYKEGEEVNIPRSHAKAATRDKAGEEFTKVAKKRQDATKVSTKDSG